MAKTITLNSIETLADTIAKNTWLSAEGHKPTRATISLWGADPILYLEGDVIEPAYELFEPVCNVYGVDEDGKRFPLFVQNSRNTAPYHNERVVTGGWDAVKEYIDALSGVLVECDTLDLA